MRALPLLLLVSACAPGRWTLHGCPDGWDVGPIVSVAEQVTGDQAGYLKDGGALTCLHDLALMDSDCEMSPPWHAAGCNAPGDIWILLGGPFGVSASVFGPDMRTTALAHELAHLGLDRHDWLTGQTYLSSEGEADAAASVILAQLGPP